MIWRKNNIITLLTYDEIYDNIFVDIYFNFYKNDSCSTEEAIVSKE